MEPPAEELSEEQDLTPYAFRFLSAVLGFVVSLGGIVLPWVASRYGCHSLANLLAAGVMLGSGILHLLPEAAVGVQMGYEGDYPLGNLLFASGLLMPLIVKTLHGGANPASKAHGMQDVDSQWELAEGAARHATEQETLRCAAAESEAVSSIATDGLENAKVPLSIALMLLGALLTQSVLAGLNMGTTSYLETSAAFLCVLLLRKALDAFALGCLLIDAAFSACRTLLFGLIFAAAMPTSILIGILVPSSRSYTVSFENKDPTGMLLSSGLLSMAGGTLAFIGMLEIIPRELSSPLARTLKAHRKRPVTSKVAKLASLGVGFGTTAVIAMWM